MRGRRLILVVGVVAYPWTLAAPAHAAPRSSIESASEASQPEQPASTPQQRPAAVNTHEATGAALPAPVPDRSPDESNKDMAREHYRAGLTLAKVNNWTAALLQYQLSYRLYPHATTLYNSAFCYAQLGELVNAWVLMSLALDDSRFAASRRIGPEERQMARRQQEALFQRLSVIRLGPGPLESVQVDSRKVQRGTVEGDAYLAPALAGEPSALGLEESSLVLTPGEHELTIRTASGTFKRRLDLAAGETIALPLDPGGERSSPVADVTVSPPTPTEPVTPDPTATPVAVRPDNEPSGERWKTRVGVAALAVGGAGVGLASVSALLALDAKARLDRRCPSRQTCPESERGTIDRYERTTSLANVGFWLGIAGSLTGITTLWVVPSDQNLSVNATPNSVQVIGRF